MRFGTQGQRAGWQPVWVGWGAQALCPAPQGCSWIPPEQGPFLPLWETCPSKYGSPRGPRGEGFPLGWRPGAVRGLHTVLGSLCSGRAPHAVALSLERATCRTDPESRGRLRPPLPSPVPARPRPVHLRPGFTAGGGAVRLLRPVGTGWGAKRRRLPPVSRGCRGQCVSEAAAAFGVPCRPWGARAPPRPSSSCSRA